MAFPSELPLEQAVGSGLANALNLASLALLVFGVASQFHPGLGGPHLAAGALLVVAALAWLGWVASRGRPDGWTPVVALAVMACAGGSLAAFAPLALVFPAVAALGITMARRMPVALAVIAAGMAATLVSCLAVGHTLAVVLGGLAACFAGMIMGISRRQGAERAEQAARVAVESERAEVERARAELLEERNHLARELHDVLAHTLSALSLQLEAFGTVVDAEPGAGPAVHEQLERTRHLVREGLDEARGAVRALREDAPPLPEQLARLCARHHAGFSAAGEPAPLAPRAVLGLYRATQEALTNVVKHAPGASTTVALRYEPERVRVTVDNDAAATGPGPLACSGGGYGLRGIAERLAEVGGTVQAGPSDAGWRVVAEVPRRA